MDTCTAYYSERECLFNTDDDGNYRCAWEPLGEYLDCAMLWPTTTTTTVAPGCCRGSSYKAQAKCLGIEDQVGCERKDCEWLETDEPDDCVLTTESPTTTTTTTEEPGCCKGDSAKTNPMCNAREGRERCEKSSSCHFVSRGDLETDCNVEETTLDPGCCYGNPDAAYSKRWMDTCTAYYSERECLFNADDDGNYRCAWEPLGEYMDCSMLWPTTTTTTVAPGCCRGSSYKAQSKCVGLEDQVGCERKDCEWVETDEPNDCVLTTTTTTTTTTTEEPGCCAGDSMSSTDKCNSIENGEKCDARASCHWIAFGVLEEDCDWKVTDAPEEPGCCYGNPDIGYSKKWMESCTEFYTEKDCTLLTNGDGHARCVWEPLGEYMDCEMLWPTTSTTTVEPGCCRGSSHKAQAKCQGIVDEVGCERKDCEWLVTDDANDCVLTTTTTTTTTTTQEPGCCKGSSRSSNDKCNEIDNGEQCDKRSSCHWISFGVLSVDCVYPATEPPEEPGCCYGNPDVAYSKRWMESCTEFYTERDCVQLTDGEGAARCVWEPLGEYMDCEMLWPTTTTTTVAPGCCRGSSYKAQAKCLGIADQVGCERKDCEWLETEDEQDCLITTTTTTTTTTTSTPGCCKGTSRTSNEACNDIADADQCDRRSSCTFIAFGILDEDCVFPATQPPEEPGCCYGNPDIAYSKRWMESCKTFGTESECLLLENDEGEPRCVFEPLGEYEDCETVWPTTTTTTEKPGCCRGSSYKAQAKCFGLDDQTACERKDCEWVETHDASDCVLTTTTTSSPTTTTEQPGCCAGDSMAATDKCNPIDSGDKCDARSSCHWVAFGVLAHGDCDWEVTQPPEDPGCCYGNPDIAYSKRWMESCKEFYTEKDCTLLTNGDGHARCVWESLGEYEDCETLWPTTTTTTSEPAGCCYGDSYKANGKCGKATDRARCEDMGCSFLETEDPSDCEMTTTHTPTTTSEPWLGAKDEAVLFAQESLVGDALNTQVSLSTLLLALVAAFAALQVYRWWSSSRNGYTKLTTPHTLQHSHAYQAV